MLEVLLQKCKIGGESMDINDREKRLLNALDWLILVIATIALVFLTFCYVVLPNVPSLNDDVRAFLQALLINLIPIPLVFLVSYVVYRRIQTIRDERSRALLADTLANSLAEKLDVRETRQVLLDTPSKEREATLKSAKELWLLGVALNKTVHGNFSILRDKLRDGNTIRVLLMDPRSTSVDFVAKRKMNNPDPAATRDYIGLTLSTLCHLKQEYPNGIDIHVVDYPLLFGAIAADIGAQHGSILVEYYSFKTARDGLHFLLHSNDKPWYEHFHEQINELWTCSEEWICHNTVAELTAGKAEPT